MLPVRNLAFVVCGHECKLICPAQLMNAPVIVLAEAAGRIGAPEPGTSSSDASRQEP